VGSNLVKEMQKLGGRASPAAAGERGAVGREENYNPRTFFSYKLFNLDFH